MRGRSFYQKSLKLGFLENLNDFVYDLKVNVKLLILQNHLKRGEADENWIFVILVYLVC